jgi:hypothetical protein
VCRIEVVRRKCESALGESKYTKGSVLSKDLECRGTYQESLSEVVQAGVSAGEGIYVAYIVKERKLEPV